MADSLKKIEDQVTCPVCLEIFEDPKQLPCGHVFCRSCLERLKRYPPHQHEICCPNCRKYSPIPPGGMAKLTTAFHINNLVEIRNSLRREKRTGDRRSLRSMESSLSQYSSYSSTDTENSEDSPRSLARSNALRQSSLAPKQKKHFCTEHPKNEVQMFCETCQQLICFECTIKKHNGHTYDTIANVVDKHRKQLMPLLEPVEVKIAEVERALSLLGQRQEQVEDKSQSIEHDIEELIRQLHEAVNTRKVMLVDQLKQVTGFKLKLLAAEKDSKESVHAQLSGCLRNTKEAIYKKSDVEMLQSEKAIKDQLEEAKAKDSAKSIFLAGAHEDTLLSVPPDLLQGLLSFGQVLTSPAALDVLKCTLRGEGLEVATVRERSTVHLTAMSHQGQPCDEFIRSLECSLEPEKTGVAVKCEVDQVGRSLYRIGYIPTVTGRHRLHVKLEGQHVKGSPFDVLVCRSFKHPAFIIDHLQSPWSVCENSRKEMLVTEFMKSQIIVYGPEGQRLRVIGSQGNGKGQLDRPRGITVDQDDNIYVAETRNFRVQKFSSDGRFLAVGGTKGTGARQFMDPKGLAYNRFNKKVYVADCTRVQVLNPDLTFSGMFGKKGSGSGEFESSFDIACDSVGSVYVSDNKNSNIQIFTPEGRILRNFTNQATPAPRAVGKAGWDSSGANEPVNIAIDASSGLVYVSENGGTRVSIFTPQGSCKTSFGREGAGQGEFKMPRGIAVTSNGNVWVCDFRNNRVQIF